MSNIEDMEETNALLSAKDRLLMYCADFLYFIEVSENPDTEKSPKDFFEDAEQLIKNLQEKGVSIDDTNMMLDITEQSNEIYRHFQNSVSLKKRLKEAQRQIDYYKSSESDVDKLNGKIENTDYIDGKVEAVKMDFEERILKSLLMFIIFAIAVGAFSADMNIITSGLLVGIIAVFFRLSRVKW